MIGLHSWRPVVACVLYCISRCRIYRQVKIHCILIIQYRTQAENSCNMVLPQAINKKGGHNCINRPHNKGQKTQPQSCCKNLSTRIFISRRCLPCKTLKKYEQKTRWCVLHNWATEAWCQNAQKTSTDLMLWAFKITGGDFAFRRQALALK